MQARERGPLQGYVLRVWCTLWLVLAGCTSPLPPLPAPTAPAPTPPPGLIQRSKMAEAHLLGPGDVLRIQVYDHPDLSQDVTITTDGSFSYPLIGQVQAAGLPVRQLEALLVQRLADGYLVAPQVGVTVTQHKSQQVYVIGAVKTPGTYPLQHQTTLLEALSTAGGATPEAGFEVMLTRAPGTSRAGTNTPTPVADGTLTLRLPLDQLMAGSSAAQTLVQDGDTVYVPPATFIYVTGEIQRPGRYRLERDTTIQKAVTLAGGFTKFAATKSMLVQRMVEGKRLDFQAGLNAVLQPDDIVVVHASLF